MLTFAHMDLVINNGHPVYVEYPMEEYPRQIIQTNNQRLVERRRGATIVELATSVPVHHRGFPVALEM